MHAVLLTLGLVVAADGPKEEPLWPKGPPGARARDPGDKSTLTFYAAGADRATGAAVVVCPGGGYGALALGHEGKDIADWLNRHGVHAFVLKYRIATRDRPGPIHPAPMQDAQRAVRTVRARAGEWKVKPDRIGIWGFSAGGHLASTVITHFDDGKADAGDVIERASCRPDFAVLCYPVITLKPPFAHGGSRKNLLGDNPPADLLDSLCNETQVSARTPPTFLFHTTEDAPVPPENSVLFYLALRKHKVPAELHLYEKGRHGVGLAQGDPVLSSWPDRLADWLAARGVIAARKDR
jgi:acetyl esterase/lipase